MTTWIGRVALVTAIAVVSFALGVFALQAGAPQLPPPPATGLIVGQVIDGSTGRPVSGAIVSIAGGARPGAAAAALELETQLRLAELGLVGGRAGPGAALQPTMTDTDGRFVYRDLARGNYSVSATLPGHVPGTYGRRRPEGPGRQLELGENERVTDVVVRVWKYASISGTIVDESGEPAVGLSVRTMRRVPSGGRRRWSPTGTATTDDRGMYRIATLVPGDYIVALPSTVTTVPAASVDAYVQAMTSGSTGDLLRQRMETGSPMPTTTGLRIGDLQVQTSAAGRSHAAPPPSADGRMFVYQTLFYPGTPGSAQAQVIPVASGEQRTGVDFQVKPVPTVRVTGVVAGPDGPAVNTGVRLVPIGTEDQTLESGFETALGSTDASGRFTLLGVPAGQYVAKAYRQPRPELSTLNEPMTIVGGMVVSTAPTAAVAAVPAGPSFFAELAVTVGDSDLDGLSLAFRPGARVSGHLEFEGAAPRPPAQRLQQLSVSLASADGRMQVGIPALMRVDQEGRFATSGYPPGKYWLNVATPGPEWIVKSIMAGAVNALEQPIDLGGNDLGGVIVTFFDQFAELSGTVAGDPAAIDGATIVAFPANHASWIASGMSPRRSATVLASKTGAYQMRVPMPGDYFLAALPADIAPDSDPQFYAALAKVGTRVTLVAGDKRTVPLRVSRLR